MRVALFVLIILAGAACIGFLSHSLTPAPEVPTPDAPSVGYTDDGLPLSSTVLPDAAPSECQVETLAAVVDWLPEHHTATWRWVDLPEHVAGLAYTTEGVVVLDPDSVACEYVASVAMHEWMHIAGASAANVPGEMGGEPRSEVTADCGAGLMHARWGQGSHYENYSTRAGGCTPEIYELANRVIAGRFVPSN